MSAISRRRKNNSLNVTPSRVELFRAEIQKFLNCGTLHYPAGINGDDPLVLLLASLFRGDIPLEPKRQYSATIYLVIFILYGIIVTCAKVSKLALIAIENIYVIIVSTIQTLLKIYEIQTTSDNILYMMPHYHIDPKVLFCFNITNITLSGTGYGFYDT